MIDSTKGDSLVTMDEAFTTSFTQHELGLVESLLTDHAPSITGEERDALLNRILKFAFVVANRQYSNGVDAGCWVTRRQMERETGLVPGSQQKNVSDTE